MTSVCDHCKMEKPLSDYYTYPTKSGPKPLNRCKKCHGNSNGYVKKGTGFAKLPLDKQIRIKTKLAIGKMKDVAEEEQISYFKLAAWVRKGQISA